MTSGSNAFFRLLHAAKMEHSQSARVGGRRAVAHLVGGCHVDKGLQFVVQVLLGPVPMDQPAHDRREAMHERHAPSSTLLTANETLSQRSR